MTFYIILVIIIGGLTAAYLVSNAEEYKVRKCDNEYGFDKGNNNPDMLKITGYTVLISIPFPISLSILTIYLLGIRLFKKKSANTKQI